MFSLGGGKKIKKKEDLPDSTIVQVYAAGDADIANKLNLNVGLEITLSGKKGALYRTDDLDAAQFVVHYSNGEESLQSLVDLYGGVNKSVAIIGIDDWHEFGVDLEELDEVDGRRPFPDHMKYFAVKLPNNVSFRVQIEHIVQIYQVIDAGFDHQLTAVKKVDQAEQKVVVADNTNEVVFRMYASDALAAAYINIDSSVGRNISDSAAGLMSPAARFQYTGADGVERSYRYTSSRGALDESMESEVRLYVSAFVDHQEANVQLVQELLNLRGQDKKRPNKVVWLRIASAAQLGEPGVVSVHPLQGWIQVPSHRKEKEKTFLNQIPTITVTLDEDNRLSETQKEAVLRTIVSHPSIQALVEPAAKRKGSFLGKLRSLSITEDKKPEPEPRKFAMNMKVFKLRANPSLDELERQYFGWAPLQGVRFNGEDIVAAIHGTQLEVEGASSQVNLFIVPSINSLLEPDQQDAISQLQKYPQPLIVAVYGRYQQVRSEPSSVRSIESHDPKVRGAVSMLTTLGGVQVVELRVNLQDFNASVMLTRLLENRATAGKLNAEKHRAHWPVVELQRPDAEPLKDALSGVESGRERPSDLSRADGARQERPLSSRAFGDELAKTALKVSQKKSGWGSLFRRKPSQGGVVQSKAEDGHDSTEVVRLPSSVPPPPKPPVGPPKNRPPVPPPIKPPPKPNASAAAMNSGVVDTMIGQRQSPPGESHALENGKQPHCR